MRYNRGSLVVKIAGLELVLFSKYSKNTHTHGRFEQTLRRLCNDTPLCIKSLMSHVIETTILTICAKGEDVFIPRIPIIPTGMLFEFKRLAFLMTNFT